MATPPAKPPLIPAEIGYVSIGSSARGSSGAIGKRSTSERILMMMLGGSTASTLSSFSSGNTSRNHPAHPTINKAMPSTLTGALVTRPANSSVMPNARTMGQEVGAGSLTSPGGVLSSSVVAVIGFMRLRPSLTTDHVNHGEHNHPHGINEVPVKRKHFQALAIPGCHLSREREEHDERDYNQADRNVKSMQANER